MRIAFYESDITPPLGEIMPGYFSERRAATVHDRLYSKACAIENNGEVSILIAVDICMWVEEKMDIITDRIQKYIGVPASKVTISATHTHLGAPVGDYAPRGCKGDAAYTDVFYRLIADSAILAYQKLDDASMYYASTKVQGLTFCRNAIMRDGTYHTNTVDYQNVVGFLDIPDDELSVLFIEQKGRKIGAIINFALHQDTVSPLVLGYTGDFASEISNQLKKVYGQDFVSLFVIGACGDINNCDLSKPHVTKHYGHRGIGERLAEEVLSMADKATQIDGTLEQLKDNVAIDVMTYSLEEYQNLIRSRFELDQHVMNVGNITAYYMLPHPKQVMPEIHVMAIGDLAVFSLPGEVYSCFGKRIKAESPFRYNIVIELSNSNDGYIPSVRAFDENSRLYETFPEPGCQRLVPEAGDIIADKALAMARTIYNKK